MTNLKAPTSDPYTRVVQLVGHELRAHRMAQNLTLGQVALRLLEVEPTALARFERGERSNVTLRLVLQWCDALHLSTLGLLGLAIAIAQAENPDIAGHAMVYRIG